MRTPRNIDAELKALAERARLLKSKRVTQLGELVVATGADALDLETLAGLLLVRVEGATVEATRKAWRDAGKAFFLQRGRGASWQGERPRPARRCGRRWRRGDGLRRRSPAATGEPGSWQDGSGRAS